MAFAAFLGFSSFLVGFSVVAFLAFGLVSFFSLITSTSSTTSSSSASSTNWFNVGVSFKSELKIWSNCESGTALKPLSWPISSIESNFRPSNSDSKSGYDCELNSAGSVSSWIAAIPGKTAPSNIAKQAPPPVEIWLNLSTRFNLLIAATLSPPPTTV